MQEFNIDYWSMDTPSVKNKGVDDTTPFTTADEADEIRVAVEAVVNSGKDIAVTYQEYLNLGFALADGLGESGREYYHALCRCNEKYDSNDCDQQYNECLKQRKAGITIKTFWKMVKDAGVDVSEIARNAVRATCAKVPTGTIEQNTYINNVREFYEDEVPSDTMAQVAQDDSIQQTGKTFSDKLNREDLPSWLYPVLDSQPDAVGRDKMLLACINLVSGLLPYSYYAIYDGRKTYPPVYNVIYGGFATSKGDLECCRQLIAPVKQEMRRKYEAEKADYEEEKAQYDAKCTPKDRATRGPAPKEPVYCSPFVTANSSASAILRALDANEGWGIMFETEADTLSNMLSKSEYGDYTDVLRKAHQHEECSMIRVTEKINIEIPNPKLSVLLTCTPSQLPLLLPPNNVANGLASRFLFYALPDSRIEFRDVFARQDAPIEDIYKKMGDELLPLYHELKARMDKPIQFVMSKENQKEFIRRYDEMLYEQFSMLGDGIQGFIFRLALECFRYGMVLAALRRLSEWDGVSPMFDADEQALLCDDRDFNTAMTIMDCLVNHTARVFSVLGSTDNDPFKNSTEKPSEEIKSFFKALPDGVTFRTADALSVAATLNIAERTAKRRLGDLVSKFDVLERLGQGLYMKKKQSNAIQSTL